MGACSYSLESSSVHSSINAMFLSAVFFLLLLPAPSSAVNVVSLGADPTGKKGSTKAFRAAWKLTCRSPKPGVIWVPKGRYLIGAVKFQGPCKNSNTSFIIHGTLVAPSNYNTLNKTGSWIFFNSVTGVQVYGGTIDGRGSALWKCKMGNRSCPFGVNSVKINQSQRMLIKGLTSVNPQLFHIQVSGCTGITLDGMRISAPEDSLNTDGIHVQSSDWVTITNARIKTGDDCISVGPGTTNLYVEGVSCGPGHGISIGSLANFPELPGVENITVKTVTMTGTQNGVRIKTWARPSVAVVRNVLYQDVVMNNVRTPIFIDQNYCPFVSCPKGNSGVKISDVSFNYIRGTSATPVAVKLDCSPSNPCTDIKLAAISLTYGNQPAQASCQNAHGSAFGYVNPPSCL